MRNLPWGTLLHAATCFALVCAAPPGSAAVMLKHSDAPVVDQATEEVERPASSALPSIDKLARPDE